MKNFQKVEVKVGAVETGAQMHNFCHIVAIALTFVGATASFGVGKIACADSIGLLYSAHGFESSLFPAGAQLLGLDGWSAAIPDFLNPNAARITNTVASHGRQSVLVLGGDLVGSNGITAPYDAVGSYRRPLGHDMSGDKPVARVEADLMLTTNQNKTPGEFFSLTIAARSGDGETLGEVGLSSEGVAEAFPFNSDPGAAPAFKKPISFNRWHHITMLLDFFNRTTTYLVDDDFLGTVPAPSISSSLSRAAMVVYARPNGGVQGGNGSERSNYTARFDGFRVNVLNSKGDDQIEQQVTDSPDLR